MMRGKPAASMQKTYDDCYLVCSTAVYFEGQNNEAEALRSWRNALDQIYYHNAYRMPTSYRPKTETEKALQDSLRQMELQCKERVDLLEALQQSRKDAANGSQTSLGSGAPALTGSSTSVNTVQPSESKDNNTATGWLGGGTIPPTGYGDLVKPPPLPVRNQPKRPSITSRTSSGLDAIAKKSSSTTSLPTTNPHFSATLSPPTTSPATFSSSRTGSRTPSPEKRGGMLRTLRVGNPKERKSSSTKMASTLRSKPPAASKAATMAWTPNMQHRGSASSIETTQPDTSASASASASAPASSHTTVHWDPYTRKLVETAAPPAAPRTSTSPAIPPPPVPAHASASSTVKSPNLANDRSYSPADYFRPDARRKESGDANYVRSDMRRKESGDANYFPPDMRRKDSGDAKHVERGRQPPPYPDQHPPYPVEPGLHDNHTGGFTPLGPPSPLVLPPDVSAHAAHSSRLRKQSPARLPKLESLPSYRKEYPAPQPSKYAKPPNARPPKSLKDLEAEQAAATYSSGQSKPKSKPPPPPIPRKAVGVVSSTNARRALDDQAALGITSGEESHSSADAPVAIRRKKPSTSGKSPAAAPPSPLLETADSTDQVTTSSPASAWDQKVAHLLKNLPKGVDEAAAKQILNEIVIKGDEVHWDDVAGLEIAKSALKETVVYPFLRPDLFMGLREPARGMLLFGPPGTGKTMLARAVATESKSTFFAISASSLTSKYLGESEKLVRALFTMAKCLAPSIIFVDEIDSLLSSRGGNSEHEATRRIKTEFLIQWSDLAKAAAGRESSEGDASRVLVLAATNLPWAIDEAARRRFVRRQYIPLPEDWVRRQQFLTLLSAQNHNLSTADLDVLVARTDGFSGSDITALAKDAAMGPLRSLGERLLDMRPEEIRAIGLGDFEASLGTIRPSVSREGLREFEEWAREFGERGG